MKLFVTVRDIEDKHYYPLSVNFVLPNSEAFLFYWTRVAGSLINQASKNNEIGIWVEWH